MSFFRDFPFTRNYDGDLGWLLKNVKDLQEDVEEVNTRLDSAEATIANHETRLTAAEGDIDALEAADDAIRTRLTTAEGDIDALEAADDAIRTRLTTAEGDIDDLEAADDAIRTRLTTAEGDIDALEAADDAIRTRLTTTEGDIDDLEAADTALAGRISALEQAGPGESNYISSYMSVGGNVQGTPSVTAAAYGLVVMGHAEATGGSGGATISITATNYLPLLGHYEAIDVDTNNVIIRGEIGDVGATFGSVTVSALQQVKIKFWYISKRLAN